MELKTLSVETRKVFLTFLLLRKGPVAGSKIAALSPADRLLFSGEPSLPIFLDELIIAYG